MTNDERSGLLLCVVFGRSFTCLTVRLARLSINSFLENVELVIRTLGEFGEDAEKADGPSKSARGPPLPSRSTDPSQAEEEEVEQQVQPHLKKARMAKGKEALRDKQPAATAAQKSRSRRGQIPPQMSADGTEASERDVDKVVSTFV